VAIAHLLMQHKCKSTANLYQKIHANIYEDVQRKVWIFKQTRPFLKEEKTGTVFPQQFLRSTLL